MGKRISLVSYFILSFFLFIKCSNDSTETPVTPDANHPPVINEISAQPDRAEGKSLIQFTCIANDYDGDNLFYEWRTETNDLLGTGVSFTWKTPNKIHTYYITCKVDDGNGGIDKDTVKLSITGLGANEAPVINSIQILDNNLNIGDTTSIVCDAIDYDFNLNRYDIRLKGVGEIYSKFGSSYAFFRAVSPGESSIHFTVYDEKGLDAQADASININSTASTNNIEIPEQFPVISEINFPDTISINEDVILECNSPSSQNVDYACEIIDGMNKITSMRIMEERNKFLLNAKEAGEYFILLEGSNSSVFFTQKVIKVTAVQ